MNAEIEPPEYLSDTDASTIKVAVIYEDFASGTRAKHFTDRLAAELGCASMLSESLWRSELLESPAIADEAARDAAGCDYLIVSLRGDRILPLATRQWIEAQLRSAAWRNTWVVALLGSDQGKRRVLNGNRHFLRSVCAANGLEFFSMAARPPTTGRVAGFDAGDRAEGFHASGPQALALAAPERSPVAS